MPLNKSIASESISFNHNLMKLILFGTGPFAVPAFENLIQSDHEIAALVTRPIADSGKRRKTAENPTRDLGEAHGLQILDPQSINTDDAVATLRAFNADLLVVCDYGQILSKAALAAAKLGGINLHGSLLPKYRGAAPIHWAIYNGDTVTGVTIIHMTPRLDGGPCLAKVETEIGTEETTEQIEPRLALLGVDAVNKSIEILQGWDGTSEIGAKQKQSQATKAPRLNKSDGRIDWSRSAAEIKNQIRAFQPWPGTFTTWQLEGKPEQRLIIHQATVMSPSDAEAESGVVIQSDKTELVVQTGAGQLSLDIVQPAGKKPMSIADFLRGNPPQIGVALG